MITKINSIKNFGIFKDFNWNNALPELSQFNLIYGWNYSGKTTLSRVFRCFEKGELHLDYLNATFEIEDNNHQKYDNGFTTPLKIRAFNSDFIRENLIWEDAGREGIKPIFLLGEKNIALQTELTNKETELKTKETDLATIQNQINEKQNGINNALTNKAREITNFLSLGRSFNKNNLCGSIISIENNIDAHIINDTDFERYKTQALSIDQKPSIPKIDVPIHNIESIYNEVKEILQRQICTSNKVPKWLADKELSDWIEKGKSIHDGKNVCEFCGNTLPSDLLAKLNEHFSKEFEILKSDIEHLFDILNTSKIEIIFPADTAFYADVLTDFQSNKLSLEAKISSFNGNIDILMSDVQKKKSNPFNQIIISNVSTNTEQLQNDINSLIDIINTNNKRTEEFEKNKTAAIEKLKLHYAAEFATANNYFAIQTELEQEQKTMAETKERIKNLKNEIIDIKTQLNEAVKGAEKVNDYLKIFFDKDDIKIEATPDNKFNLKRGIEIAKNLSEGEKTAIAFAYFITKLKEYNNDLADTIVYIDDPVSSLDARHLFAIYSFIKDTFYEYDEISTDKHKCKCSQLFIATHNFEFYNLVYDWFKKTKKEQRRCFTIERIWNTQKNEATIKESSGLIQKYNSEYAHLFSLIYGFYDNPSNDCEYLYHLPNICRRFVETYLHFKYLSASNIEEHINYLIIDNVQCEKARKFMHYYSHNLTNVNVFSLPDFSECQDVVKIIIEAVQQNDEIHFNSLKAVIA